MASWRKYFTHIPKNRRYDDYFNSQRGSGSDVGGASFTNKYSSYLPEVYAGEPQRIQRYTQYDHMDSDPEVNAALDTIAEFCTQNEEKSDLLFNVSFFGDMSDSETQIINETLRKWSKKNKFKKRLWRIVRNVLKYGDCFFIRDPETFELYYIPPERVQSVVVNEAQGKEPTEYIISGLDLNTSTKVAAEPVEKEVNSSSLGHLPGTMGNQSLSWQQYPSAGQSSTASGGGSFGGQKHNQSLKTTVVDAKHVVHLSLSEGLDKSWPFGNSILESVFKTYKQKELLEDSVIIYRVQRAPERRIFYVDVGQMPPHKAMNYVERIKNEIHQKRIPNRTGGGSCLTLDTEIPLLDGRTLSLNNLIKEYKQGKQNWVYSVNPDDGSFAPGKITWAGETRKNAQIIRLTLDNGEQLTVTPDHGIPVWGKGKVEAKDIKLNVDSIISFNTRLSNIDKRPTTDSKIYDCLQVFDHADKKWKFIHKEFIKWQESKNKNIHEYNVNSNNFRNNYGFNSYDKFTQTTFDKLNNHIGYRCWKKLKSSIYRFTRNTTKYQWNDKLISKLVDKVLEGNDTKRKVSKALTNDSEFMKVFCEINKNQKGYVYNLDTSKVDVGNVVSLVQSYGYKNFSDFKRKIPQYNHKVVSVEWLVQPQDTGTITVDGDEELHDYHTFGVSKGIYVFNSIMDAAYNPLSMIEDYFFAQTSDGRGSKVDTLPGGESLGEINDLNYFDQKLKRGLRVPPSYLPTIQQDQGATYNDGRVGTAYIQEYRFSVYCKRIQNLLADTLDHEFKMFMKFSGVNVDSGSFEIDFHEPQSFSKFRQIEVDTAQIQAFQPLQDIPYMSKRFLLERFLNLSEDEILRNEKLWAEENAQMFEEETGTKANNSDEEADLSTVGVRSGNTDDVGGEMDVDEVENDTSDIDDEGNQE